jgi:tyrosinase
MGTRYLDLDPTVDRRIFIKGLGVISTGLVMATLGGCEALFDQIANRPVRRRLRTGSPEVDDVIVIYQDAVNQMRALPGTDPRSWDAQAAIHGTVTGGFNFCQHGTDHFFSWHRAYLLYFEQICQELTGEDSFGLPYWNWNQDPDMHPEFTDPASPLNHPRINTSVAGNNAFTDATLDTIFGDPNFYTFGSQIEGTPHNTAHVVVGGDMVTGGSPLDPVFWANHCMVDYCWAKWNIELENDNTNDQAWLDTSWNHFVVGDGDPVEVSSLSTVRMTFLSYH